jgi:hypothetical protein
MIRFPGIASAELVRAALLTLLATGLPGTEALASGKTGNSFSTFGSKLKPKRGEPAGCLAGSLGRSVGPGNNGMYFNADLKLASADEADQSNPETASVRWTEGALDHRSKLVDRTEVRDAFVICLRPGKYVFQGLHLTQGTTRLTLPQPYNVPVEVVAGKTFYIGSFITYLPTQSDDCGTRSRHMRVLVRDNATADRAAIAALQGASGHELVIAIPDYSGHQPTLYSCMEKGDGGN